jgi:hypothetical protein
MTTLREASKGNFNTNFTGANPNGGVTFQEIQAGCIQRIADAIELTAKNYLRLQSDLEYYKRRSEELQARNKILERRIAAQKGLVTKLKKGHAKS